MNERSLYACDPYAMNNAGPSYKATGEWFDGYTALEVAIDHDHFYTCAQAMLNAQGIELDNETPERH